MFDQINDWNNARLGKFTASEIHKLMQKGRGKDEYFGSGAITYVQSRLAEITTQEPCVQLDGMAAIEHGNANEHDAVLDFQKHTGLQVEYFGKANPMFVPYAPLADWAGGSPDGYTSNGGVIEVKAPYNPTHHIKHLLLSDAADLKKEKPEYYGQIQFNMMCSGRNHGYFISYDPRVLSYKVRRRIIEVPYDDAYCTELDERLHEAVKLLRTYMDCIEPDVVLASYDTDVKATICE